MSQKIEKFFKKHSFLPEDIKYIIREDGKTAIHLIDDRVILTYITVKELKAALSPEDFLYPNKGIVAATSQIVNVRDGAYEMVDGRVFKYRVHNSIYHDNRLLMLGRRMEQVQAVANTLVPGQSAFDLSAINKLPLAFCVIELIFDEFGRGVDFILRYCNGKMAEIEGHTIEEMKDRSLTELFCNIDKKWLVIYADVAVNDTVRTIEEHHALLDKDVRVYCYQPIEGFCACVMTILE